MLLSSCVYYCVTIGSPLSYASCVVPCDWQKYKGGNEDSNMSGTSEPGSPQSSPRSRSPSPDDILERVAADVKEYELENLDTFEANVMAKQNLLAQEKEGTLRWYTHVAKL